MPRAAGVLCSLGPLGAAAASSGFMDASPDADGILRRMPQIVEFGGEIYPSLALATVATVRTGIAPRRSGSPTEWGAGRLCGSTTAGFPLTRTGAC